MKHTYEKHTKCEVQYCMICDGGLQSCTTCYGAESSLTIDCYGSPLSSETRDKVSANKLDYKDNAWLHK